MQWHFYQTLWQLQTVSLSLILERSFRMINLFSICSWLLNSINVRCSESSSSCRSTVLEKFVVFTCKQPSSHKFLKQVSHFTYYMCMSHETQTSSKSKHMTLVNRHQWLPTQYVHNACDWYYKHIFTVYWNLTFTYILFLNCTRAKDRSD